MSLRLSCFGVRVLADGGIIAVARDYQRTLEQGVGKYGGPKRVDIVGAGMAGLVAAWLLMRAGFKVTVYEASAKVGGRVRTLREGFSSGLYAEAGAMRVPYSHRVTYYL